MLCFLKCQLFNSCLFSSLCAVPISSSLLSYLLSDYQLFRAGVTQRNKSKWTGKKKRPQVQIFVLLGGIKPNMLSTRTAFPFCFGNDYSITHFVLPKSVSDCSLRRPFLFIFPSLWRWKLTGSTDQISLFSLQNLFFFLFKTCFYYWCIYFEFILFIFIAVIFPWKSFPAYKHVGKP